MHIEVDHSWQIEKTQKGTALSFSNKISRGVFISAATKRKALRYLRTRYQQVQRPYLNLYAACFFILLKPYLREITSITIDADFPGHERDLKGMILNYLQREGLHLSKKDISFSSIGKKSRAHLKALRIFRGQEKPDHEITIRELEELL